MHFHLVRSLAFLVAAIIVGACVYLYAASQAGRAELRKLCEQGLQPNVYRKVSAEGYFDGGVSCLSVGCWRILTARGYRFIEFEKRNSKPWHVIPRDGFYRISKVRRDSGECHEGIYAEMTRSLAYKRFIESGYCLALEKLEGPRARYGVFSEKLPTIRFNRFFIESTVLVRRFFIRDLQARCTVAERKTYLLSQHWPPSFSSFRNILGCRDVGITSSLPDLVNVESYIRPE